jgi:hypothetical protein
MVMHPHTKYHWPISKEKNVMTQTRKYYLKNNYLTLRSKVKVPRRSLVLPSFSWINGELIILPLSMVNSLFYLYQWWTHYFTWINGELIILPLSMVNSLFYLYQRKLGPIIEEDNCDNKIISLHLCIFQKIPIKSSTIYVRLRLTSQTSVPQIYVLFSNSQIGVQFLNLCPFSISQIGYMIDSDESPDSTRCQLLKSVSTDVIMSNNGLI